MANNSDDYTLSENEESRYSSDENIEITPVPLIKKTRRRPAKSSKALGKQKVTSANEESLTALESSNQTSIDSSNPFVQIPVPSKPQVKSSWVWDYYIKRPNEKGEICAYCQFVLDNGEKCSKHYKYDGSTGNLNQHIIKHGITPPTESTLPENKPNPAQSMPSNIGQKEKEKSTL